MSRIAATAAAIALVTAHAAVVAQQRFTSGVDLVMIDVLARRGRQPLGGLTATDFELFDNGVRQSIRAVELEQLPVNVVLVLDTSASVAGHRLVNLKEAARSLVRKLRDRDRAAVISFSHRVRLRSAFTSDRERLTRSIGGLGAEGGTAVRDAAYAGLALSGSDPGRTLLVLFTDGLDTSSFLDEGRIFNVAQRSDVVAYAVGVRESSAVRPMPRESPTDDRFLRRLAEETGGRLVYADADRDLGPTFDRVFDEFNRRYVLAYTPTDVAKKGWHRVEVRLKTHRAQLTARRGYFVR